MRQELEELCNDLGLSFRSHDSHGYYLDVRINGHRLMIDPTPDNVWKKGVLLKSWIDGALVVRDDTHFADGNYDKPTHLVEFNRNEDGWLDRLRVFLTDGIIDAKPVNSITGKPLGTERP